MALSRLALMGIALVLLIAVSITAIVLYTTTAENAILAKYRLEQSLVQGRLSGAARITHSGVLSYNNSNYYVEYASFNYQYSNALYENASVSVYVSNPLERMFFVNTGFSCFRCLNESMTYSYLEDYLYQYGIILNQSSLNYVNLSAVPSLPANSVIIIPSGLIPSQLLPYSGTSGSYSNSDILSLMRKGDTIIYAGENFSRSIQNGINYISSPETISALGSARLNQSGTSGYVPSNTFYFRNPSFSFTNGTSFGPISYTRYANGTIIAFSGYPSSAWSGPEYLAHDIAFAISNRFWIPKISSSYRYLLPGDTGSYAIFTTKVPIPSNSSGSLINDTYPLLTIRATNGTYATTQELPFSVNLRTNGTLGMPGIVPEGVSVPISIYISNTQLQQLNAQIGNFSKNALLFHLELYNSNLDYIYSVPIGFFNTSLGVVIYHSFTLAPGYYVVSLADINSKVYDNALIDIPYFTVTPLNADFKNGTFTLEVTDANTTVSNIRYTISLNGQYPQTQTLNNGIINYTLPQGTALPYGNQTLTVSLLGGNYSYFYYYSKPITSGIPPIYIEFAVAAIAIILFNIIAKAPNRDDYFIDVPTFPPTSKFEVKTSAPSIINLFDTMNERFGWSHMPLTAEEIKLGISSNVRYKNMPIMITMENTAEILYKLANEDKLDVISPYFMPKKWSTETHHDIEYLIVFRKLRDFSVKNAILFTELDTGTAADMIMTNKGKLRYIYIYSKASSLKPMRAGPKTQAYIAFIDNETMMQFLDKLYVSYGEEEQMLRMAISSNSIMLISTENLDQLLY